MGDLLEALTREMLHDTVIRNAGLEKLLRRDLALGVLSCPEMKSTEYTVILRCFVKLCCRSLHLSMLPCQSGKVKPLKLFLPVGQSYQWEPLKMAKGTFVL